MSNDKKELTPDIKPMLDEVYNKAIDDAIEIVKVQYASSGFGLQSPLSSPLQGTSRGSLTQKIISKLQQLKKQ